MDLGMVALRLLHVGGGILWAGATVLLNRFVAPTWRAQGPAATPFMAEILERRRMWIYLQGAATVTVLAGSWLYWIDSNGDPVGYLAGGGMGTGLGVAGILAWVAFSIGTTVVLPSMRRVVRIAGDIGVLGGPPPPDLLARLATSRARLRAGGLIDLGLLSVVVVCMATARYWPSF
jgi:hypothetical protein